MQDIIYTGSAPVTSDCYYQIDQGVIAFTDTNDKLWIKQ
jgi:hypothetical protein